VPILPPATGPIPAQQSGGTCSLKGVDIIKQAMLEIGAIDPNENPTGPESSLGLIKLNRMLDAWNVDKKYVYTVNFAQYVIVPNLQPHLIGPSGTAGWIVNQRPVKLESAEIILNNVTPNIRYPLNVRDATWWAQKSSYQVTGTLPTDVYYEPDWPNGSLFIWPVPTIAYPLELQTWTILNEVQLNQQICLPPGYLDCICYELAIALCPSFQTQASRELLGLAKVARDRIFSPNIKSPRIGTRDAGIPQQEKHRATFNYRTGSDR
jgi:hypothetical protein